MKKGNQKGFMLAEAFIISTVVLSILIFMFIQIRTITNGFNRSFSYNTVSGIYIANEMGDFIRNNNYEGIMEFVDDYGYFDLSTEYLVSDKELDSYNIMIGNTWKKLLSSTNVKKLIVSKEPMVELKSSTDEGISKNFINFINSIPVENYEFSYRIIIEYNDYTYASVRLS